MTEADEKAWGAFIASHPLSSVYHHPLWHRVIERTYGFKARYHVSRGGAQEIRAGAALTPVRGIIGGKRLVSYPFSDSCDPLARDAEGMNGLMTSLEEYRAAGSYRSVEIRGFRMLDVTGAPEAPGYFNFVLGLDKDADTLFRSFHRDCVQRAVKKAGRIGVEVTEASELSSVREFYRLHLITRKRHGMPPQPFRFFRNLWEILRPEGMASLYLAGRGGITSSAMILLRFRDVTYYKYGASSLRELPGANQLLMWTAIKKARDDGGAYFDLGRTYPGNRGLMEYKSRWGASPWPMRYFLLPGGAPRGEGGALGRLAGGVMKKMPAACLRLAGELLYKYLA